LCNHKNTKGGFIKHEKKGPGKALSLCELCASVVKKMAHNQEEPKSHLKIVYLRRLIYVYEKII
jgi:hypothetical protein